MNIIILFRPEFSPLPHCVPLGLKPILCTPTPTHTSHTPHIMPLAMLVPCLELAIKLSTDCTSVKLRPIPKFSSMLLP